MIPRIFLEILNLDATSINDYISNEELMKIINDIKEGKNDDSFLYAIVKKALEDNGKELKKENNGEHRRY